MYRMNGGGGGGVGGGGAMGGIREYDDVLIFGNFEDDLEMNSTEVELNSADFDHDNFMLDDDEIDMDGNEDNKKFKSARETTLDMNATSSS